MARLLPPLLLLMVLGTISQAQQDFSDDLATFELLCPDYAEDVSEFLNTGTPALQTPTQVDWAELTATPSVGTPEVTVSSFAFFNNTLELVSGEGVVLTPTQPFNALSVTSLGTGVNTFIMRDSGGSIIDTVIRPAADLDADVLRWIAGPGQMPATIEVVSDASGACTVLGIITTTCALSPTSNSLTDIQGIASDVAALLSGATGANANRLQNAADALADMQDPSNWDVDGNIILDGFEVFSDGLSAVRFLGRVRGADSAAAQGLIDEAIDVLVESVNALIDQQAANGADQGFLNVADSFVGFGQFFNGIGRDRTAVIYLYYAWLFADNS